MSPPPQKPSWMRRGLLFRVYLINLAGMALISLAFGVLKTTLLDVPWHKLMDQRARYVISHVAHCRGDVAAMQREAEQAMQELSASVSIYDYSGNLLVSNVNPPLPKLTESEHTRLSLEGLFSRRQLGLAAVPISDNGRITAYGVVSITAVPVSLAEYVTLGGAILLVLAIASWLLTAMVVRPLKRLSAAARALGAGDMTARVCLRQKDELGAVARTFDEMADRITHLLRGHKELLANVSHELRTPLASIRVALELANEGDAETARELLSGIASDLSELERLVEDILITARLDLAADRAGDSTPPLRLEWVAPALLIAQSAARFLAAYPDHRLEVRKDALPGELRADRALLRRALDNILDNAGKYSDAGTRVTLTARNTAAGLELAVQDQGIGIAAEDKQHLFTPFFRSDPSRARTTGGIGLGLTMARRIVEAHDGTLVIDSRLGEGTIVVFKLPLSAWTSSASGISVPPQPKKEYAEQQA